jgi:hypothetical protein
MEVFLYPCSGSLAQIDADIEAIWMGNPLQQGSGLTNGAEQVQQLGVRQVIRICDMTQRSGHQVPPGVGIAIEHDQRILRARQNQTFPVAYFWGMGAEDTPMLLRTVVDIVHPPGGPNSLHQALLFKSAIYVMIVTAVKKKWQGITSRIE